MNIPDLAVQALVLIVRHLKQFGFERILCLGESFKPYSGKKEMILSGNTLQQLEVSIFSPSLFVTGCALFGSS